NDHLPAVVMTDAEVRYRPLLSDVSLATMTVYVSGILYDYEERTREDNNSVKRMRDLSDDVYTVLTSDPQWGTYAKRTRLVSLNRSTEEEEQSQAFIFNIEIDYIEIRESVSGSFELMPLPVDGLPSKTEEVSNALYNALLTAAEVIYVER